LTANRQTGCVFSAPGRKEERPLQCLLLSEREREGGPEPLKGSSHLDFLSNNGSDKVYSLYYYVLYNVD